MDGFAVEAPESWVMLLLDSEALSALAHGPAQRRDRVRALIALMRNRNLVVGTVAAVLAELVRGRPADAEVFAVKDMQRLASHAHAVRVVSIQP